MYVVTKGILRLSIDIIHNIVKKAYESGDSFLSSVLVTKNKKSSQQSIPDLSSQCRVINFCQIKSLPQDWITLQAFSSSWFTLLLWFIIILSNFLKVMQCPIQNSNHSRCTMQRTPLISWRTYLWKAKQTSLRNVWASTRRVG